jgi:hypothetical protein
VTRGAFLDARFLAHGWLSFRLGTFLETATGRKTHRWHIGQDMAGEVLLPGDGARLAPASFDDWLAAGAP